MADNAPSTVVDQLELALAKPEPMCLAIVKVVRLRPPAEQVSGDGDCQLLEAARQRMSDTLRKYDEMVDMADCNSQALIMRTLADATVLNNRMRTFFDVAAEPYIFDGQAYEVRVILGAAIRKPQDTARTLLDRVEMAMQSADGAGAVGPVVV